MALKAPRGKLEKMILVAFKDIDNLVPYAAIPVMYNPTSFTVNHSVAFDQQKQPTKGVAEQKFNHINPRSLSVELMYDGTSASPSAAQVSSLSILNKFKTGGAQVVSLLNDQNDKTVEAQIKALLALVYQVDLQKHRTPFLMFVWGSLIFPGVVESANVSYSLFSPDGTPLRAKVTLSAKECISNSKLGKIMNLKSPDLTQSRTVIAGDTLPNLAKEIYEDESLYIELAKVNGLHNYRRLKPGSQLLFPPIEKLKGLA